MNASFHLLTWTEGSLRGRLVDGDMIRSYGGEGGDPDGQEPIVHAMGLQGRSLPALHKTLRTPQRPLSQVTACPGTGQAVWVGHKGRSFWCFPITK